jgi:hypothetical protein
MTDYVYKIGMTNRSKLEERLKEYYMPITLLYTFHVEDAKNIETWILNIFNEKYQLTLGRERFIGCESQMLEDIRCVENYICNKGEQNDKLKELILPKGTTFKMLYKLKRKSR